jgi:hypothetical protein
LVVETRLLLQLLLPRQLSVQVSHLGPRLEVGVVVGRLVQHPGVAGWYFRWPQVEKLTDLDTRIAGFSSEGPV